MNTESTEYTESRIQQEIVRWYNNSYCLVHNTPRCMILSVPNEGNPHLSQIGALAGTSDLIVFHRNTAGQTPSPAFIEVKTPIGRVSPKQRAFQIRVSAMGYEYRVVRSLDDFKEIVKNWQKTSN